MICEIKHKTGSSGSCLGYDFGDKTEKDQQCRIVAQNGLFMAPSTIRTIEAIPQTKEELRTHKKAVHDVANRLSVSFDKMASFADERVKTPFVEYIISFSPDDREKLTPAVKEEIVLDYLERMGVHGGGRDTMFVATEHLGTNAPHIHVFTCRVDMQTMKATDMNGDWKRNKKVCEDLSVKYGLAEKTRQYKRDISLTNDGYAVRLRMRDLVRQATAQSSNGKEFSEVIRRMGMGMSVKRNAEGGVRGLTFTLDGHTYSGSQLGHDCTYNSITSSFAANWMERKLEAGASGNLRAAYVASNANAATLFYLPGTAPEVVEKMRLAVKSQGYCAATQTFPKLRDELRFRSHSDSYRIGYVESTEDGHLAVYDCKIVGDAKLTEGNMLHWDVNEYLRQRREKISAHTPKRAVPVTFRPENFLEKLANSPADPNLKLHLEHEYEDTLRAAEDIAVEDIHKRYDELFRKAELDSIDVKYVGFGEVELTARIKAPGKERLVEESIVVRNGAAEVCEHAHYYSDLDEKMVDYAMQNVFEIYPSLYTVLEKERRYSGRVGDLSQEAAVIATGCGKRYVMWVDVDSPIFSRYNKHFYISEELRDDSLIEDMKFFSKDGETVSFEQAQVIASEENSRIVRERQIERAEFEEAQARAWQCQSQRLKESRAGKGLKLKP